MNRAPPPPKRSKPQDSGDVDAYMKSLPTSARTALQKLRKAIGGAALTAEEGFSYGLPAFRLEGRPLVCYAAWKNHCSLYPMSSGLLRTHAHDLKAYDTSKGTIKFTPEKPLPAALVRKLVKARIAELRKPKP
ncbi:MAG: DUF1801 domain-containing protein [Anaerolineales bacterium]|nr:DUF1801 domain-containing protein [Anaerolineales bacterium]